MNVAIIGGGISGLTLAHRLRKGGAQVTLFEANAGPGGTMRSQVQEGFITEAGPNGFLDREPTMRTLVSDLGLTSQLRAAAPAAEKRFVFTRGALRLVPHSPPGFLKSDILPVSARLRVMAEIFSTRAKQGADESLAQFARRHLGSSATNILVDAMQSGIFAGDPERLSLEACFPRMAELEREHRSLILAMIRIQRAGAAGPTGALTSFAGGLQTLTDALTASLQGAVRVRTPVRRIIRRSSGYLLELGGPMEGTLEAENVVVAVPAPEAARMLAPLDASLGQELSTVEYASVAAVHLGFDSLKNAPEGFGCLVPAAEGRKTLGVLYVSSFFPWRAPEGQVLLTCMVGGARNPQSVQLSDELLLRLVREELASIVGVTAAPYFQRIVRWPQGIPQYNVGHLAKVRRIDDVLARFPGLYLTGNALKGVGMNDCVRNAFALSARILG